MSKTDIITNKDEQLEMLIRGMKQIFIGSPMDAEEYARECLEQIGIDTKDTSNFRLF
jgi:hypothetical protein